MDKADVWMPLFIGDYLADTSRLTTEQHGAYFLLIMDYWRNGPPPDDAGTLAQITRLSPDAWSIAQAKLMQFFSIENGVWHHKRIDAELIAAKENKGKAQAKAKAAAEARWGKHSNDAPSNAPSIPQAMHEECPSPSPSPTPSKATANSKADASASPRFDPKAELTTRGVDPQTANDFLQNRKKGKLTQTALNGIITEADKAGYSLERALALACKRGWQSFEAAWVLKDARGSPGGYQTANDKAKTLADRLTGKTRNDTTFDLIDINSRPP